MVKQAVMKGIDALFNPESVAVLGASRTPGKVGHDIFNAILKGGYEGTLYPVNPTAKSICSVKAYPSITDIPDQVDLAIVVLSPRMAEKSIREAIDKGVHAIVICSAGFKEVGGEGIEIEKRITEMCREAGVRVVGPNCLGVINPVGHLNASFSVRMPKKGNISFISQSGALCTAVLDFAADRDFASTSCNRKIFRHCPHRPERLSCQWPMLSATESRPKCKRELKSVRPDSKRPWQTHRGSWLHPVQLGSVLFELPLPFHWLTLIRHNDRAPDIQWYKCPIRRLCL